MRGFSRLIKEVIVCMRKSYERNAGCWKNGKLYVYRDTARWSRSSNGSH